MEMFVILCNSFEEARSNFEDFISYLEECEPDSIVHIYKHSFGVDTDCDIRYVFIDYRMRGLFRNLGSCFEMGVDEFMDGLYEYMVPFH